MRLLPLLCALSAAGLGSASFSPTIVEPDALELELTYNSSALYRLTAKGYDEPIYIANITGSTRFEMGYAYGYLLSSRIDQNFAALLEKVLPNEILRDLMVAFLDFQFRTYLLPHLPKAFREELDGVEAGAHAAGSLAGGLNVRTGITLANVAVGDVEDDLEYVVLNELCDALNSVIPGHLCDMARGPGRAGLLADLGAGARTLFKRHCSMAGVWGSRTEDGRLFSMRNLDWLAQSGLSANKLITVWHPPRGEGRFAHAAVGFAGLYGALAGVSSQGVTVHEAGLDSRLEGMNGMAWVLRLREVMEVADSLDTAMAAFNATGNTVGVNHGLGSGRDARMVVLETNARRTAVFGAGDGREAANPLGAPLTEAVWRTNHAYDPEIIAQGLPRIRPHHSDSLIRYNLIGDAIRAYAAHGRPMGVLEAVNITALAGDKDGETFNSCAHASNGENILSVTFDPTHQTVYAAFENGFGPDHVPAACGSYVHVDLTDFFAEPVRAA